MQELTVNDRNEIYHVINSDNEPHKQLQRVCGGGIYF